MSTPPAQLAGTVRWAIVPYTPRPPFRIYAEERAPYEIPDAEQLIRASRKGGDAEFTYLVSAKARPLLILSELPLVHHHEVTALRLLRFSKLDPAEQQDVRDQKHELLFHLDPSRFDLPEENAAMVSALERVHVDAISSGPPLGQLDDYELRVIGERIIRFYKFDIRLLLERRIRELAAQRSRQP